MKVLDDLIEKVSQYLQIPKKQATKIVKHIIDHKIENFEYEVQNFIEEIKNIKKCKICFSFTQDELCEICLSPNRDKKLMIIENQDMVQKYEEWKIFNGKYFLIPILYSKKFTLIKPEFDFTFLLSYIDNFDEIIISLSPIVEGVMTSNLIFDTIKKHKPNIKISQLAIGIPLGSTINYMDQLTMTHALKNRKDIK